MPYVVFCLLLQEKDMHKLATYTRTTWQYCNIPVNLNELFFKRSVSTIFTHSTIIVSHGLICVHPHWSVNFSIKIISNVIVQNNTYICVGFLHFSCSSARNCFLFNPFLVILREPWELAIFVNSRDRTGVRPRAATYGHSLSCPGVFTQSSLRCQATKQFR